eukprot:1421909-Amphidinium_carterae.1
MHDSPPSKTKNDCVVHSQRLDSSKKHFNAISQNTVYDCESSLGYRLKYERANELGSPFPQSKPMENQTTPEHG